MNYSVPTLEGLAARAGMHDCLRILVRLHDFFAPQGADLPEDLPLSKDPCLLLANAFLDFGMRA
ncbi:MAG: hypothetical protein U0Z75_00105 [Deinococcaceae bacterium]